MKKQLLKESDIRRMMKFANISALSDGFVGKLNETYGQYEEELMEADPAADEDEEFDASIAAADDDTVAPAADPAAAEAPMTDVDPESGAPMSVDAGATYPPEVLADAIRDLLDKINVEVAKMTEPGQEPPTASEVPDEAEAATADAAPLPDEDPTASAAVDDEDLPVPTDLAAENIELEEDEALGEGFVNEVTRRVARRLIRASKISNRR